MDECVSVITAAKSVAACLRESTLYRDYLHYKTLLESKPVLAAQLRDFKNSQAEFEYNRLINKPVSFEDEKRMSYLYTALTLHEDARHFLDCERELLSLYRQVFDIISSACEIEIMN